MWWELRASLISDQSCYLSFLYLFLIPFFPLPSPIFWLFALIMYRWHWGSVLEVRCMKSFLFVCHGDSWWSKLEILQQLNFVREKTDIKALLPIQVDTMPDPKIKASFIESTWYHTFWQAAGPLLRRKLSKAYSVNLHQGTSDKELCALSPLETQYTVYLTELLCTA